MSTFMEFCAVKDDKCYCGGKPDIVQRVCEYIRIDPETRRLSYKVKGYVEDSRISFSREFSHVEMQVEAFAHVWGKLEKEYGFTIYHRTL